MKKYTKQQILEAISIWQRQLDDINARLALNEASAGVIQKYFEKHLILGKNVIEWRDQLNKWYSDKSEVKDVIVDKDDGHGIVKDFGSVKMDLHVVSYSDDKIKYPDKVFWPHFNTLTISNGNFRLADFVEAVRFAVYKGLPRMDKIVGYGPAGCDRTNGRCESIIDTLNGKKAWFKLDRKYMYDKYGHRKTGGYHATTAADLAAAEKYIGEMLRGKEITIASGAYIIDILGHILEKSEAYKSKEKADDVSRNIMAKVPSEVTIPDDQAPEEDFEEILDLAAKFYGHPNIYEYVVPNEEEEIEGERRDLDDWDIYRINRQDTISQEDFYEKLIERLFEYWGPGETVPIKEFAKTIFDQASEISETALEEYDPSEDDLIHRGVYKSEAYWRS